MVSILSQYCINVSDMDKAIEFWEGVVGIPVVSRTDLGTAAGCESVSEPMRTDRWPVTIAFVKDQDGYLVEFVEYHEGTNPGVPDPKKVGR